MKLRYALTLRVTQAEGYVEPRDSISQDWIACLDIRGIEPVLIPNGLSDPVAYLDAQSPDLFILTGGDDLGATPMRDETETRLLDHALSTGLPVFGVCRGMQLINRHFGGTETPVDGHVAIPHGISVTKPLAKLYGDDVTVNSFHALGIEPSELGDGLHSFATDNEGRIEAFYHPDRPIAAVMWHPERDRAGDADFRLMEQLATQKRTVL